MEWYFTLWPCLSECNNRFTEVFLLGQDVHIPQFFPLSPYINLKKNNDSLLTKNVTRNINIVEHKS